MLRFFTSSFKTTLYAQIWENRIKVVNIKTGKVFDEKPHIQVSKLSNGKVETLVFGNSAYKDIINPFSHPRVLLANFFCAEKLLSHVIMQLTNKTWLYGKADIIIHPRDKLDGGLTQVEVRAFQELGEGAGAEMAFVHVGDQELDLTNTDFDKIKKESEQ